MVFLVPLIVGVGIGLGRGGRFTNLASIRFQASGLVAAAAGLTLTARVDPGAARWMIALSLVLLVAFLFQNRSLTGFAILTFGVALNAMVMIANGAMPVSSHAAGALGETVTAGVRHGVASDASIFPYLGDVIPVTPLGIVVSAGDILMAIGIVAFLSRTMNPPRTPAARAVDVRLAASPPGGVACSSDGAARQLDHARGLRPLASATVLRGVGMDDERRSR